MALHRSHSMVLLSIASVCAFVLSLQNAVMGQDVTTAIPTTNMQANAQEMPRLPKGCMESICGSVVSKCLLTQSCKCGPNPVQNNITCARDCFFCLDYLYTECCSCVDVCRKDNVGTFSLSQKSNVEDLPEPMPELFQMLMESSDSSQGQWTSLSFPAHHTVVGLNKDLHFVRISAHPDKNGTEDATASPIELHPTYDSNSKVDDVNCSVAYMKPCLSLNKCRENCISLGASSYRWFHDGCCECVGSTCLNYGLHEGRCLHCPLSKDMMTDTSDEEIPIQNPEAMARPPVVVAEETLNAVSRPSGDSNGSKLPNRPQQTITHPTLASTTPSPDLLGKLHKSDDNSLV